MTKTYLYAIDNQTPFTFFVRNQDYFYSNKSDKVTYYVTVYPGRTWITKDGKSDGENQGWPVVKYDSKHPTNHGFYFLPQDQPESTAFYLSLKDDNNLYMFTDATSSQPKTVCSIPKSSISTYQLNIQGSMLNKLKFSMRSNVFPTWMPASSGIAGVLNNSPYTMIVRTCRACLNSSGGVSANMYTIDPYQYGDYGTECWMKDDMPEGTSFNKTDVPARAGIAIPIQSTRINPLKYGNDSKSIKKGLFDHVTIQLIQDNDPRNVIRQWTLYQFGVNILQYSDDQDSTISVPNEGYHIDGGHSFSDTPLKYLEVVGPNTNEGVGVPTIVTDVSTSRLRLVSRPSDLTPFLLDGHSLGPNANLIVKKDTELFKNFRQDKKTNKLKTYSSYVTRILFTKRDLTPINGTTELSISQPVNLSINGEHFNASDFENNAKVSVKLEDGVVSITQSVDDYIGTLVYSFNLPAGDIAPSLNVVTVEVHGGDKVTTQIQKLQTQYDYAAEMSKKNKPVFNSDQLKNATPENIELLSNLLNIASLPRNINPILVPIQKEITGDNSESSSEEIPDNCESCEEAIPDSINKPHTFTELIRPKHHHCHKDFAFVIDSNNKVHYKEAAHKYLKHLEKSGKLKLNRSVLLNEDSNQSTPVSSSMDISSLWDSLCNYAKSAWKGVTIGVEAVKNVLYCVLDGVKYVIDNVSQALSIIGAAIAKIFDIAFKEVVKWLGDVLDWKIITPIYNYIYSNLNKTIASVPSQVSDILKQLKKWIDPSNAKDRLTTLGNETSSNDVNMNNTMEVQCNEPPSNGNSVSDEAADMKNSAIFNWASDAMKQNSQDITQNGWDIKADLWKALQSALTPIQNTCSDISKDISDSFKEIFEQWDTLSIMDIFTKIFAMTSSVILDAVNGIIDVLDNLFKAAIQLLNSLCSLPIYIPILTPLWQKYCGSGTTSNPTMLQMVCFSISIPSAYMIKFICYLSDIDIKPIQNIDVELSTQSKSSKTKLVYSQFVINSIGYVASLFSLTCYLIVEGLKEFKLAKAAIAFFEILSSLFSTLSMTMSLLSTAISNISGPLQTISKIFPVVQILLWVPIYVMDSINAINDWNGSLITIPSGFLLIYRIVMLIIHFILSVWYLVTDASDLSSSIRIFQFTASILACFVPFIIVTKAGVDWVKETTKVGDPKVDFALIGGRTIVEITSLELGYAGTVFSFLNDAFDFQMIPL